MWGHMNGYGMGAMGLGMSLFWILLIVGIVLLVKMLLGSGSAFGCTQGKTALDILKERYARGEINKDEFDQKKLDLDS
ncbi:SHOCT domain-containing protein [Methylotenera sp.]|uniref:SHOCT domain-containing protein n=1 Tax=Methylotenera sp. TaxID=2051956 RepID=UPI00273654D6|nr:SHOCT domain-containing protein [Methylotenera sp.]MDP3307076.1 SHOCT domain-containing protein [Methylotenera sp.]